MKAKKFTFKAEKATGAYRAFSGDYHIIKFNKKDVGNFWVNGIWEDAVWSISLRVIKPDIMEDGNPNCVWKNITLKYKAKSLPEAKEWLNANIDLILSKYELHLEN